MPVSPKNNECTNDPRIECTDDTRIECTDDPVTGLFRFTFLGILSQDPDVFDFFDFFGFFQHVHPVQPKGRCKMKLGSQQPETLQILGCVTRDKTQKMVDLLGGVPYIYIYIYILYVACRGPTRGQDGLVGKSPLSTSRPPSLEDSM